jgi:hypothetical protein
LSGANEGSAADGPGRSLEPRLARARVPLRRGLFPYKLPQPLRFPTIFGRSLP